MIMIAFLLMALLGQISAQEEQNLTWFTNLEVAKEYAAANEKDILMVFAGSDWCRPCKRFKKDILDAKKFKTWGSEEVVILYLDFPAKKKNRLSKDQTAHNEALSEQYNKSGYLPYLLLIDSEENVIGNPKYWGQSPKKFVKELMADMTP